MNNLVTEFKPVELSGEVVDFQQNPFEEAYIEPPIPFDDDYDEDILSDNLQFRIPDQKQSSQHFSSEDVNLSFEELLKQEGVHFRISSGYRKGAKTKQGRTSHHSEIDSKGNPMAYDIVPNGVSWKQFKQEIYGNPRIMNYLRQKNWGILDETIPSIKQRTGATGDHLHVGPDQIARKMLSEYINNPSLWSAQEGIKVPSYLNTEFQIPTYTLPKVPMYFTKDDNRDKSILESNAQIFRDLRNRGTSSSTDSLTNSPFYNGNELPTSQSSTTQSSSTQASEPTYETYTGKGAEALSNAITEFAKTNPDVEKYRNLIMFTAYRESRFNPGASTPYGTACGWFGMTEATRRTYAKGLTKEQFMNNPQAQVKAAYELMKYYLTGPTYEKLKTVRGLNDKQIATLGWLGPKYYQDYAKYGHAAYDKATMRINGNKNVQDFLDMYKS